MSHPSSDTGTNSLRTNSPPEERPCQQSRHSSSAAAGHSCLCTHIANPSNTPSHRGAASLIVFSSMIDQDFGSCSGSPQPQVHAPPRRYHTPSEPRGDGGTSLPSGGAIQHNHNGQHDDDDVDNTYYHIGLSSLWEKPEYGNEDPGTEPDFMHDILCARSQRSELSTTNIVDGRATDRNSATDDWLDRQPRKDKNAQAEKMHWEEGSTTINTMSQTMSRYFRTAETHEMLRVGKGRRV
jgi:hypothetical protein